MITMFLVLSETRRMSGLRVVLTTCWRNQSCFSRSTESCQSWADARVPAGAFSPPAFAEQLQHVVLHTRLQLLMASAIGFSTWLWHQVYQPWPSAVGQELRTCSSVPFPGHSWQFGVSTFPQAKGFAGLGRTSAPHWFESP